MPETRIKLPVIDLPVDDPLISFWSIITWLSLTLGA